MNLRRRLQVSLRHVGQGEVDVLERRLWILVSHEPLEYGQADPGARHVRAEGVPKPVRIGVAESGDFPARPKDAPKAVRGHGVPPALALQTDEEVVVGARPGPLVS